jgi:hypothetical protein
MHHEFIPEDARVNKDRYKKVLFHTLRCGKDCASGRKCPFTSVDAALAATHQA